MFKHTSKKLLNTQAYKQDISSAQAQKQETFKQTQLHINMFRFKHLIYY